MCFRSKNNVRGLSALQHEFRIKSGKMRITPDILQTPTRLKMTVFWDVVSCRLVEIDRRFRGAYCLHHQDG
jgi:hypothetical protein